MSSRIPWNKHEASLLLDYCVRVQKGDLKKRDAIKELSQKLRQMAIINNKQIDEIYRNENGISWQMSIMEAVLNSEDDSSLLNHNKLFVEIVHLYKRDSAKFEALLIEDEKILKKTANSKSDNELSCNAENKAKTEFLIRDIFRKHFPNGIRDGSKIELNKFKSFIEEEFHEVLSENDNLIDEMKSIGFVSNGRIYVIDEADEKQIENLIQDYEKLGNNIIYFEEFYTINKEFLNSCNIYAPEVLKSWIYNHFPQFCYDANFFSMKKGLKLEEEIKKAFGHGDILSTLEVKNHLPYMSMNVIRRQLEISELFVRVCTGGYMLLTDIYIDENIFYLIQSEVDELIAEKGYASLAKVNLYHLYEHNPYCSQKTIKTALGKKFDKNKYAVHGDFVTPLGKSVSISSLFKNFCISNQYLTEQDLLDFEDELTGERHGKYMKIASDNMIQINKNEYVAKNVVRFDVDCTDMSIERFMKYEIIGLQEIDSFVTFPIIEGYEWNSYLLQSFCRFCSQRFSFMCMSVNSKCVGAIYRSEKHYKNYADLLTDVLWESGIKEDGKLANELLIKRGFIARPIKINDILARVHMLSD